MELHRAKVELCDAPLPIYGGDEGLGDNQPNDQGRPGHKSVQHHRIPFLHHPSTQPDINLPSGPQCSNYDRELYTMRCDLLRLISDIFDNRGPN